MRPCTFRSHGQLYDYVIIIKYTVAQTKLNHAIKTYPHTPPVSKLYPGNPNIHSKMRLIINKLPDAGVVHQFQSTYVASAFLLEKKNHSWTLLIDYKK
ncbi:unnamed protein product [Rotaria sp. Silwood1]|nr:unnamed protein product [Rotaria sp. Silwood1]CAF1257168.1 unnamed protein product [Rotaria sp. Silwood1]CAF3500463.1 unnamed protein product [Rotaria sp. Silwood1]CAF4843832.1 unnamed protein product [Rotaria sp. Silwood1]